MEDLREIRKCTAKWLGQKTYKNIFHCEKESFTAQTPRKNSMKKIDFKEKSAL